MAGILVRGEMKKLRRALSRRSSIVGIANEEKTPRSRKGLLPEPSNKDRGKLCVVVDMDETLLHTEFIDIDNTLFQQAEERELATRKADFKMKLRCSLFGGNAKLLKVYLRPGLKEFLKLASEHFELVVFTAALPVYANAVLDKIDKNKGGYVAHRLFRGATVSFNGQRFVKDLSRLGRDMRRTVLIDNNPFAMLASPDNAIPILSFFDSTEDTELSKVLDLLMQLKNMDDVRPYLKQKFCFREKIKQLVNGGSPMSPSF